MVETKILPIKYPIITSLPGFANTNAILSAYPEIYTKWFCQNFVQLVGWKDPEMYIQFFSPLFRKHYNLFDLYHIPKHFIENQNSLTKLLVNELKNNNYIYISIDKYFISAYNLYKTYHEAHDMLIYGYNMEKGVFYIADFFTGKYEFSTASFLEVENAFFSSHSQGAWFKGIQILTSNFYHIKLDIDILCKHLTDYINMKKSSKDYILVEMPGSDSDYWGIGTYELLFNTLNNNNFEFTVLRSAHLLYDHKLAMLRRILLLAEDGYITEHQTYLPLFEDISKRMLIIRNKIIKAQLSKKIDMKSISELISINRAEEIIAIQKLISDLRFNNRG